jgi:hypothetical protein
MNILEHMMALSLQFADLHREFAQDYADVVAAYNPEGHPEDNIEEDGELNRINQKWLKRLQRLATIAVIGLALGAVGAAHADQLHNTALVIGMSAGQLQALRNATYQLGYDGDVDTQFLAFHNVLRQLNTEAGRAYVFREWSRMRGGREFIAGLRDAQLRGGMPGATEYLERELGRRNIEKRETILEHLNMDLMMAALDPNKISEAFKNAQ